MTPEQPKYGVTFDTWMKLSTLASELLFKGIKDGGVQHEPDKFREQGYTQQLKHAANHIEGMSWSLSAPEPDENHLAHALTRILFAALLKEEETHG